MPVSVDRPVAAAQRRRRAVGKSLALTGFVEVLTSPFVAPAVFDEWGLADDDPRRRTTRVLNPLESEKPALATTLLPALLEALNRNVSRGSTDVALFAVAQVVTPTEQTGVIGRIPTDRRPTDAEIAAVYRAIAERRDMRHFRPDPVAPALLERLLWAAHHAPSVGYMQPWRFIRITDRALRERLHGLVEVERRATARALGEREDEFMRLKVEGLLEAAELLAVCLADGREQHVFGRRTLPQMDLASASCAIQNLWLAARAEGLGMGWVSLFDPAEVAALLGLPPGAEPIALLCLGPVHEFYAEPMLQQQRWASRQPLNELVFDEGWGQASTLFDSLDSSAAAASDVALLGDQGLPA